MRSLAVVLVLVMGSGVAHAQSAPSPTLERAIKLYEKEDYYSATIELHKVQSGETADTPEGVQRAEWFQAKAQYQLGWYASALAVFQRIQAAPAHAYHDATLKWLLALARMLPEGSGILQTIASYSPDSEAAQQLGELRDEYVVLFSREQIRQNDFEVAAATLAEVRDGSAWWPAAQQQRGLIAFRAVEVARGVALLADAAADPTLAPLAVHDLAMWSRLLRDPTAAADALGALAGGTGAGAAAATYARSRLDVERVVDLVPLSGLTDTFDALALASVCTYGTTDDLLAKMRPLATEVWRTMRGFTSIDDNAELFEGVSQYLGTYLDDDAPDVHVLRLALGDAQPLHWQAELAHERKVLDGADRAWLTTAIAYEIRTELELQAALADADAGNWLRNRFASIMDELAKVEDAHQVVAAGPSGPGVIVPAALCTAAGLHAPPATVEETPTPLPPPPAKHGCAGCASSEPASGALVLLALAMAASSRARRRRPR